MNRLHFIFLPLLCIYVFIGWVTVDPDFGWRIRMGQLILKQGMPPTDPFSFTMMRYPFVDHEWLTHVWMFIVHNITNSNLALSFFFGLFAVATLHKSFDFKKNTKNEWIVPALLFLVGSSFISFVGIRPQIWGWLLLVIWIQEFKKGSQASLLLLCFIQLLWVNTHGSFFLGIGTGMLFVFSQYFQKKEIIGYIKRLSILFCVTFMNPYGWRVWWEVWMQLSDYQLRWRVGEWTPGVLILDATFWFYSVIFFSLFIKKWRLISLYERLLILFFFFSALSSARNMPLFLLVSVLPCIQMWLSLERSVSKEMKKHFYLLKNTIVIVCFLIGIFHIVNGIIQLQPIHKEYPVNAIEFLMRYNAEGRIYSEYDWGGYIIWKAPTLKVFIDGRMPSWRWKQNDPQQSNNSAEEYFFIAHKHPPFEFYRKKYDITYALMRKGEKTRIFSNYKKIYEDDLSIIYKL